MGGREIKQAFELIVDKGISDETTASLPPADSPTVDRAKAPKRHYFSWLLWWQIDPVEIDEQVSQYATLGFMHSARKLSVLCVLLSSVITLILVYLGATDPSALIDAGALFVLSIFIYFGHRWAIITTMLLWTYEKGFAIFDNITSHSHTSPIMHIIWWCIYMHCFYFAFRVEHQRKNQMRHARLSAAR